MGWPEVSPPLPEEAAKQKVGMSLGALLDSCQGETQWGFQFQILSLKAQEPHFLKDCLKCLSFKDEGVKA